MIAAESNKAGQELCQRDMKTLVRFIEVFCDGNHPDAEKSPAALKIVDVEGLAGHPVCLCADCSRLLTHALVKRCNCPMDPKPQCKHCPNHCYHPTYRDQIKEVMKYSGRKLVMRGRVDYLLHLLF